MADLLVKLYELPDASLADAALSSTAISIRRALPTEVSLITSWVRTYFDDEWAEAAYVSTLRNPSACYLAVLGDPNHVAEHPYDRPDEYLVGFACYDSDFKGMFGPIGVRPEDRNRGIGTALLLRTLAAMRDENYAYAVIGWADAVDWYERTVGAVIISGSEPGIYGAQLRASEPEAKSPRP